MTNASLQTQGYLRSAWLILVLALAYGAALAGVQTALAPRVQYNKRQQTYAVIPELVPGAVQENTVEVLVRFDGVEQRVYQTYTSAGTAQRMGCAGIWGGVCRSHRAVDWH